MAGAGDKYELGIDQTTAATFPMKKCNEFISVAFVEAAIGECVVEGKD